MGARQLMCGKSTILKVLVGLICCILPIVGVVFLAIGLSAEDGDSKNDFDYMGKACTVVEAFHNECHSAGGHGTGYCYDCYTYSFTATTKEVYMSTDESVPRNDGYCEGNRAQGSFYVGQAVHCWSPKVNPPPSFYRCTNPPCYKILDPAIDSKEAVAWKKGKMLVGYCCLGFGVALTLCFFLMVLKDYREKMRYHKSRQDTVPVTVVGRDDKVLPEEDLVPCESRMPVVGDQVTVKTAKSSGDFRLLPGSIAAVTEVDADGDFCLRDPAGNQSNITYRSGFFYFKQDTMPGAGQ